MKHLAIILFFIGSTLPSYSQVYKLKAFNTYFSLYDDNGKYTGKEDSTDVDFLVVINLDKNKIDTYGKKTGTVDLVSEITNTKDKMGNTWLQCDGVDEFGERCLVKIIIFKDQTGEHKCTLYVDYPKMNRALVYRLKKDE